MFEALIHGKLSSQQENMEDVLTSCVFGAMKVLRPSAGIYSFLSQAHRFNGQSSELSSLSDRDDDSVQVEYTFWPKWTGRNCHPCEPDVLIRIRSTQQVILIEAKLRSGKSSNADGSPWPYDQLAREWDNLLRRSDGFRPVLIYLTADDAMPRQAIQDAIDEFEAKRPASPQPDIYWLSWQQLMTLDPHQHDLVVGLQDIVQKLNLLPFTGFSPILKVPNWTFVTLDEGNYWINTPHVNKSDWSFDGRA